MPPGHSRPLRSQPPTAATRRRRSVDDLQPLDLHCKPLPRFAQRFRGRTLSAAGRGEIETTPDFAMILRGFRDKISVFGIRQMSEGIAPGLDRKRRRAGSGPALQPRDAFRPHHGGDPLVRAAHAGRHPRAGRDQLGPDQHALQHDARDLRRAGAGPDPAEHRLERRHRIGGDAIRRPDAGLQDRRHDRQHAALPHVRAAARDPGGRGGGVVRLSAAARHLRHRRRPRAPRAHLPGPAGPDQRPGGRALPGDGSGGGAQGHRR